MSAVVAAPIGGGRFDEVDGEWIGVDGVRRSDVPVFSVVTRVPGVVAQWGAGIAASRGDVLVLASGAAPRGEEIERHAAAYVDPRLAVIIGDGLWSARRSALDDLAGLDRYYGGRGWFAAADTAARLAARGWDVRREGTGVAPPTTAGEWEQWAWNAARYARKHRQRSVVSAAGRAGSAVVRLGRPDALPAVWDAIVGGTLGRIG